MRKPLKVLLIDPAYFQPGASAWVGTPLNVGFIAAYAESRFGADIETEIHRDPLAAVKSSRRRPPDILGISRYVWNRNLTAWVARTVKRASPDCLVVVGGPEVDEVAHVQADLMAHYEGACDFLVPNEGEAGFANIVEARLGGGREAVFENPLDGVVFWRDGERVAGDNMFVGLSIDLASVPSPILAGRLDRFLAAEFYPFVQTSRVCPYSCTFCVSGRNRGKLRHFPLEVVQEEIRYIAERYRDYPFQGLFIADDDFGINKQDVAIAETVMQCSRDLGWPKSLHCTTDKKFRDSTMRIAEIFNPINRSGFVLSLQTLTDETLEAVKRKNLPVNDIDEILAWARDKDIEVTSELIFGLPRETKDSFLRTLDYCIEKGINCGVYGLSFLPGAELSRPENIEKFSMVKKFRPPNAMLFQELEGEFVGEYEPVSVGSDTLPFEDYLAIRKIVMMVHAVVLVGYFRPVLRFLVDRGFKATRIFDEMTNPKLGRITDPAQRAFADDLEARLRGELKDTGEEVIEEARRFLEGGGSDLYRAPRTNVYFAARMIYEDDWAFGWFRDRFDGLLGDEQAVFEDLLEICRCEWIGFFDPVTETEVEIGAATAARLGFDELAACGDDGTYRLRLTASDDQLRIIRTFTEQFRDSETFYYDALTQVDRFAAHRHETRTCTFLSSDAGRGEARSQVYVVNAEKQIMETAPTLQ